MYHYLFPSDFIRSSVPARSSAKEDEWQILELSSWYSSSSKYTTAYELCDASIMESADQSGEFYVVGGFMTHYEDSWRKIQKIDANDENKRWIVLENVTIPQYLATTHAGLYLLDNRLYIIAGQVDYGCGHATRAAACLNMFTGDWVRLPDVPEARYAPAIIVSDNRVHLLGGAKPDRITPADDYWILDLDHLEQGWTNGPRLPHTGDHGIASLIDDWIYFYSFEYGNAPLDITHTGVWDRKKPIICPGSHVAQPQVMKIQPKYALSSQWICLSAMPHAVNRATSLVLNNRWIMVFGGMSHVKDDHARNVQLFDTIANQWRVLSPLSEYARSPLVWIEKDQSVLYLQTDATYRRGQTQQAHIIWSQPPKTEKCLFFTRLNCTTRKLARTLFMQTRLQIEMKWNRVFSRIYLMNMPIAIERLRRVWYQLNKIDLTSITLLEAFQIQNLTDGPPLIREDKLLLPRMRAWKKENNTRSISRLARLCHIYQVNVHESVD